MLNQAVKYLCAICILCGEGTLIGLYKKICISRRRNVKMNVLAITSYVERFSETIPNSIIEIKNKMVWGKIYIMKINR